MALRAVPDHENAPKPLEVFGFGRAQEVNSSEPAEKFSREIFERKVKSASVRIDCAQAVCSALAAATLLIFDLLLSYASKPTLARAEKCFNPK